MKRHLRRERSRLTGQVARFVGMSIAIGAAAMLTMAVLPSARRYLRMKRM